MIVCRPQTKEEYFKIDMLDDSGILENGGDMVQNYTHKSPFEALRELATSE